MSKVKFIEMSEVMNKINETKKLRKRLIELEKEKAERDANERLKELQVYYRLGQLVDAEENNLSAILRKLTSNIVQGWQYPSLAYARVVLDDFDFKTSNYKENGAWVQRASIFVNGIESGYLEIGYTYEIQQITLEPFLNDERSLLNGIAERIGRIAERIDAKTNLEYQLKFQKMVAEISSDFVQANVANIDEIILRMLQKLGSFFDVDRTYVFFFDNNYEIFSNTHEWCSIGTPSVQETMQQFKIDSIPWWKQQILNEKSINVPDIEKLPSEAATEKKIFRQQQIKSLLTVPIVTRERITGFFGFDAVRSYKSWNHYQVGFLKVLANIVADAYVKVDAEAKVKESEEKYRLITENASDVIWALDVKIMRFTYISPAIKMLRGITPEEAMNETLQQAVTPDSFIKVQKALEANLGHFINNTIENDFYIDEIQQPCTDGSVIWVEISTRFRYDKNGNIEVVGVSRNIEERKRMEHEIDENTIRLRELNATKDKFFSIISHDLKSPFNSIMGMSGLLVEEAEATGDKLIADYSKIIYDSSEKAMNLLTNLLEWSRAQTGRLNFNPHKFSLSVVVANVVSLLSNEAGLKHISIKNNISQQVKCYADEAMLNTVLRNLVSNAIKFSYTNGIIEISSKNEGNATIVSVSDTGVGLSEKVQKALFRIDQHISTKGTYNEEGTGLGLLLCCELIEKHGGRIWVESVEGKGSTFSFSIPRG